MSSLHADGSSCRSDVSVLWSQSAEENTSRPDLRRCDSTTSWLTDKPLVGLSWARSRYHPGDTMSIFTYSQLFLDRSLIFCVVTDCRGSLMDARTLYWWESWAAMTMNPYRNSLKKEEKWILLISFIVHIINSVFQSETFRLQDSLLEDSVSAPWTEETPAAFKDSSEAQTSQHQCSCVSKNLVRT